MKLFIEHPNTCLVKTECYLGNSDLHISDSHRTMFTHDSTDLQIFDALATMFPTYFELEKYIEEGTQCAMLHFTTECKCRIK